MTMLPQPMILWRGLELLCCCRKYESNSPVSGAVYTVLDFTGKTVTVCLHKDYVFEGEPPQYVLTHKKAATVLRLQFAICIAAIQGRTFRDTHMGLLDLESPHLTMRDAITAMSRPTNGKYMHFVSASEQTRLLAEARRVTDADLEAIASHASTRQHWQNGVVFEERLEVRAICPNLHMEPISDIRYRYHTADAAVTRHGEQPAPRS